MGDVFVQHHTVQDAALLDGTAGHLFHTCVSFNVDSGHALVILSDGSDSLKCKAAHKVGPADYELGTNRRFDEGEHFLVTGTIDGDRDALDDF